MTANTRRKITLQLIPLLDMLLILIFIQYMEMQDSATAQLLKTREAQQAAAVAEKMSQVDKKNLENLKEQLIREQLSLDAEIKSTMEERDRIAGITAELLTLPAELLKKAFTGKTDEEINKLKKLLAALPTPQAADVVHQMSTLSEWRRTCDIWQIHIDESDIIRISFPPHSTSFRAESYGEFERRMFDWYKTLPPPKTVVIMQLTWGDASFGTRFAAKEGLVRCGQRMRSDRNGRNLFEYTVLGFRPQR